MQLWCGPFFIIKLYINKPRNHKPWEVHVHLVYIVQIIKFSLWWPEMITNTWRQISLDWAWFDIGSLKIVCVRRCLNVIRFNADDIQFLQTKLCKNEWNHSILTPNSKRVYHFLSYLIYFVYFRGFSDGPKQIVLPCSPTPTLFSNIKLVAFNLMV